MRHGWWFAMLLALPAAASDFAARYPAGSVRDAEAARAALQDADAEMLTIARNAKSRDAECYRRFFVNSCREDVRREKELAEREVQRVRVEARDLQRRLDAEQVARQRAESEAKRAAEDAQRPQKAEQARADANAREAEAKRREPAGPPPGAEPNRRPAPDRLTAAERAENERKFREKQEQAQQYAQQKDAERKENERRRAERRKQVEQREAEREAIRKKAAESIK